MKYTAGFCAVGLSAATDPMEPIQIRVMKKPAKLRMKMSVIIPMAVAAKNAVPIQAVLMEANRNVPNRTGAGYPINNASVCAKGIGEIRPPSIVSPEVSIRILILVRPRPVRRPMMACPASWTRVTPWLMNRQTAGNMQRASQIAAAPAINQ